MCFPCSRFFVLFCNQKDFMLTLSGDQDAEVIKILIKRWMVC